MNRIRLISYKEGSDFLSNNELACVHLIGRLPEVAVPSDGTTLMTRKET